MNIQIINILLIIAVKDVQFHVRKVSILRLINKNACLFQGYRDLINSFGISQKKINSILNKEEGDKLEALLAEEETISECKSANPKLLDFIC